jgi:hypothetical protein
MTKEQIHHRSFVATNRRHCEFKPNFYWAQYEYDSEA